MTHNNIGRNGTKSKFMSVVTLALILFCLVIAKLLRVPHIGGSYDNSSDMAILFQTALSVSSSSSSYDSSARDEESIMYEREAQATRPSVEELISTLRDATQTAARGEYFLMDLTGEERERWNRDNSCKSRLELNAMYKRRRWANDLEEDDGLWDAVLEEYSKLHRVCLRRVGRQNLQQYFLSKTDIPGCKFAIADYTQEAGLGNKILAITNTILYSILTQRVVLVPTSTLMPELMCEPFVGSSWVLDSNQFPLPPWADEFRDLWTLHQDVYQELDQNSKDSANDPPPRSKLYASSMEQWQYQPGSRFFCDAEQESFNGVTWLYFTGSLYTISKLFAIPAFRGTLEELFPSRLVLTRMLRSVMLPNDVLWRRIVAADAEHLKGADRRVGLQIRFRYSVEQYVKMCNLVNQRVLQCGLDNGFLPSLANGTQNVTLESRVAQKGSRSLVKVFVASLFTGFADFVKKQYLPHPKSNGEEVTLVQLSSQINQAFGLEVDRQSLTEIFMLSFCDDLLVTPLSTFGGIAQAYGNLVPWILEFREEDPAAAAWQPCQRGQTVDVCYQDADQVYSCPHDHDLDKKRIPEVVPYIKKCLEIDALDGLQLISKNTSGRTEFPLTSDSTADLLG